MVNLNTNCFNTSNVILEHRRQTVRKEDEQAIRRTVALLKIKCQEQKACSSCPFYILTEEGNHVHHGCIFDVPPAYLNAEDIINNM